MYRILMSMVLAIVLSACAGVSRFERSSLVAFGELLDNNHEPVYYLVRITIEQSPDTRTISSLVKLSPDATPLAIAELRPDTVARYLSAYSPPPQWPDSLKRKAKQYEEYQGNGFHVVFKNDRLISVGICSNCAGARESPVVGTPDGQQFYQLPLTGRQIAEVFGSPDRISQVREVTY